MERTELEKWRLEHNLSQKELSTLIGVSQPLISNIERRKPVGKASAKKLSDLTKLPIEFFLFPKNAPAVRR